MYLLIIVNDRAGNVFHLINHVQAGGNAHHHHGGGHGIGNFYLRTKEGNTGNTLHRQTRFRMNGMAMPLAIDHGKHVRGGRWEFTGYFHMILVHSVSDHYFGVRWSCLALVHFSVGR